MQSRRGGKPALGARSFGLLLPAHGSMGKRSARVYDGSHGNKKESIQSSTYPCTSHETRGAAHAARCAHFDRSRGKRREIPAHWFLGREEEKQGAREEGSEEGSEEGEAMSESQWFVAGCIVGYLLCWGLSSLLRRRIEK